MGPALIFRCLGGGSFGLGFFALGWQKSILIIILITIIITIIIIIIALGVVPKSASVVCGRSDAKAAVEAGALQPGEFRSTQQQSSGHFSVSDGIRRHTQSLLDSAAIYLSIYLSIYIYIYMSTI